MAIDLVKIPEGYELIGYGKPEVGESYVSLAGPVVHITQPYYNDNFRAMIVKKVQWEPKEREPYYYIASHGTIHRTTHNHLTQDNKTRVAVGNCFPTKELAKEAAVKIKTLLAQ